MYKYDYVDKIQMVLLRKGYVLLGIAVIESVLWINWSSDNSIHQLMKSKEENYFKSQSNKDEFNRAYK